VFTATATAKVTMGGVTVTRSTDSTHGSSGPATKTYVDGSISLSPLTATNEVGQVHTITATVTQNPGTGSSGPASGVTVNFSRLSGDATFVTNAFCVTDGTGTCTIQITSPNAGTNVIHATATWTVNTVVITRSTGDNLHGDGSDVAKTFVDATISIVPSAINEVGTAHTFTITATAFPSGTGTPTFIVTDSVSPTPNLPSTDTCPTATAVGNTFTCTLTINSSSAGVFTATATAKVTMGGVTVTRSTDSTHGSTGPATKTYVDGSISLTPLTATNFVGQVHTITAIVTQDPGTGSSGPASGVTVNFSRLSGDATFVSATFCVTDGTGTCTIQITSPNAGTNVIHATATWTVNTISITRSTGDTFHGDGSDVQKIFIPRTPLLLTTVLLGDTVNITGFNLAGTADFTLYGPSSSGPVCSGTPLASFPPQPLTVSFDMTSATASTPSTTAVTQSGVYSWLVTFNTGNSSNTNATTTCTSEVVTIAYSPGQVPPAGP
jgi:hypothetical protein